MTAPSQPETEWETILKTGFTVEEIESLKKESQEIQTWIPGDW